MSGEGSSRGARSRPGMPGRSSGFSTRDFSVIDQSVNLMDMQGDRRHRGEDHTDNGGGGGGLTGLFRTREADHPPNLTRGFNDSSRFDYEYGDADATDAEEYIDPKRRRHFGTMHALCRQKKFLLTLVMAGTAFLLVLTTFHSFELLKANKKKKDNAEEENEVNAITNGTSLGYGATNRNPNNNVVLEQHYTRKRYDDLKRAVVDAGATPSEAFDTGTESPRQAALDWLVFEDAAFLGPDDEGLLDRYGLAVLWFSTNPGAASGSERGRDAWKSAQHWMTEHGICSWGGIECLPVEQEANKLNDYEPFTTVYDGNAPVTSIVLPSNNLGGTIPGELGTAFSELLTVDLEDNNLGGTLPAILREAPRLRDLLVTRNNLGGTIPADFVTLRNLHQLGLGHNDFEGPVWHDEWSNSLTKLRYFAASHNRLTGTLPDFSKMTRMNGLYLSSNKLEGSLPASLSGMSSLLELKLSDNNLTGGIEAIRDLENLEVVHIANNKLSGTIPDMFDQLFRLHDLALPGNKFGGTIPKTLTHLQTLRYLDLEGNDLTGSLPPGLGLLTDVVSISLGRNGFGGSIPTILGKLDDIKTLMLSENKLTGTIPTELGGCFRLQTLHLQSNELVGSIPTELGALTGISSLRVEANNLDGKTEMPPQVCALRDEELSTLVSDCKASVACGCCTECA